MKLCFSGSLNHLEFCFYPLSVATWNTIDNLHNMFTSLISFSPPQLKSTQLVNGRAKDKTQVQVLPTISFCFESLIFVLVLGQPQRVNYDRHVRFSTNLNIRSLVTCLHLCPHFLLSVDRLPMLSPGQVENLQTVPQSLYLPRPCSCCSLSQECLALPASSGTQHKHLILG